MKVRTLDGVRERQPESTVPAGVPLPQFRGSGEKKSMPVATAQSGNLTERDMRMVDVNLIDPNPYAPREVYTAEMVLQRAEALRTQGQHDPIHLIPNPDDVGRFIIVDGWTRVLACVEHSVLESLLAEIHHGLSVRDAAWFGYQQNEERKAHCDLDRAFFYKKMIDGGESAADVALSAKVSKSLMSFFVAFTKLPEDVLEIARQYPEKFGANAAYQLHKLNGVVGVRKAVSLALRFVEEDRPVSWLINQVQAQINPDEREHKKIDRAREIKYGNGFFRQNGDKFEMAMAVAPEKQAEFAKALEHLLESVALTSGEVDPK